MRNIERYSWWGHFQHTCFTVGLDCYGIYIKGLFYIHWHTGRDKQMSTDCPWFRIRCFEIRWFGKEIKIPFIKHYSF